MQPDFILPSPYGNIAVEVGEKIVFDGMDVMAGYAPAFASEMTDAELAQELHDHGIAAASEILPEWEAAGLLSPDCADESVYGLAPCRYTLFYWTSDGASEYNDACGWNGFGGAYAVSIGMYGEPSEQGGSWPTVFRGSAVTVYIGHPFGDRELTEDELEDVKSELAAAAASVFEQGY